MNRFALARYPRLFDPDVHDNEEDDSDEQHRYRETFHRAIIENVDNQPTSAEDLVYQYMIVKAGDQRGPAVVVSSNLSHVEELPDPIDFFRERMALDEYVCHYHRDLFSLLNVHDAGSQRNTLSKAGTYSARVPSVVVRLVPLGLNCS